MRARPPLVALIVILSLASDRRRVAADPGGDAEATLVKELPKARLSLLDGVRAVEKDHAVALSAKFEDEGAGLSLSVYTAAEGLGVDAEHSALREHAGDPRGAPWTPSTTRFEDREHVARAAEQLTLLRLTKVSIADVLGVTRALSGATVFSVTPTIEDGRAVFAVRAAAQGEIVTVSLDLQSGVPVGGRWPRVLQPPEPTPLVGTALPEPVAGAGRWIGTTPTPLAEAARRKVVLVATNSYLCETTDEAYAWPVVSKWSDELGPKGLDVRFIVGEAASVAEVEAWVAANKLRYSVLHDPAGENARAWGLGRVAFGLVLGADGRVVWQGQIGPQGDAKGCEAALRRELEARFGSGASAPR